MRCGIRETPVSVDLGRVGDGDQVPVAEGVAGQCLELTDRHIYMRFGWK